MSGRWVRVLPEDASMTSPEEPANQVREALYAEGDFRYDPHWRRTERALAALSVLEARLERAERERDERMDIPGAEIGWNGATTAAQREIDYRRALLFIDRLLTTAEGDNIPRGEAPKMQAREIARQYLAALARGVVGETSGDAA